MSHTELLPIGAFAQCSGLTASALRFYADSGLLTPAKVDAVSGYRFYDRSQLYRALLLWRLRQIDMPLATVESVLDAEPDEAIRLVEQHVSRVLDDAAAAQRQAATITASLTGASMRTISTLSGPVFAAAIDQVLAATAHDAVNTVLNGVCLESAPESVTVTATDRYRLARRSLLPGEDVATSWAATINADDLRAALPALRRSSRVTIVAARHGFSMRLDDGAHQHCRLLTDSFPDYRVLLAQLPEVSTRIAVDKTAFLHALEEVSSDEVSLRVRGDGIAVGAGRGEQRPDARVLAGETGRDGDIRFAMTTLYPAVSTVIGADLLLDLRGPDQPATVRSADHGDLTSLIMPIKASADA